MKINTHWNSLLLLLLIQTTVQSTPLKKPLSKLEATELLCAAARGPLGSMTILLEASRLDKTDHKQLSLIKMLHYFVLIANDGLAIYNRNQEHHWHEYIRLAHDISYACSTANSLRKSHASSIELSNDDEEKENLFREKVRFFLPLLESAGAIYVAHSSNDQSPDAVNYRSLAQGFISLAHYLNEYLRTQNTTLNRVELGLMATTCLVCFHDLQDNDAKKMRLEEEALRQKEQAQRKQEEKKQREESVRKEQEQREREEREAWNRYQAEFTRREEERARLWNQYQAELNQQEEAARQTRAQAGRAEQARQAAEQAAREEEATRLESQRRQEGARAERERVQQEMARRQAEFLRKQAEDAIKAANKSGNSDKPECSICYEEMDAQATRTTIPGATCRCTQPTTYHAGCIDGWVNQQGTCPVCQSRMKL